MDTMGRVEAAISSFREKKKNEEERLLKTANEELQNNKGSSKNNNVDAIKGSLNEPISLVGAGGKETGNSKADKVMEEFDQFVQYNDLRKKAEVVLKDMCIDDSIIVKDACMGDVRVQIEPVVDVTEVQKENATEKSVTEFGEMMETGEDEQDGGWNSEEGSESEDVLREDVIVTKDEEYLFPTPDEICSAKRPEVGMVFSTLAEAVRFVNVYGKVNGFAVIKGRNYKQRKITLQCNKSRKQRTKTAAERKRRRHVLEKTDCQMSVTVKCVGSKWQITSCFLEHNHDLATSPSLTKFFLSHRTMTEDEILLSKLLQEIRVKPQKIMTIFRRLNGSFGSLTFGKKKVQNLKQAEKRQKKNSDIACTLKYIERIQLTKPGFLIKMEVDGGGTVRSIFWTDARSRLDYKLYGEIISFDTTYSTNRYNMPFAPIVGINGHAKTIVFGWALLKDQKADTFQWMFESFVEVMDGKRPKLILTDQDSAMALAISRFFSDVFHRCCIFHILQNLKENMSAYMADKEGMEDTIVGLILESLHIEEFETGWHEMVATYNCGDHAHIKRMWEGRAMFVSAYFKGCFCPFTRSTGRSESFNSNFKDYVMRKDSIENFLKQYELFQENIVEIENADRFESTLKIPTFWCHQPIERHAAKIYTKGIYMKFVTELLNSTAFKVTEKVPDKLYELDRLVYYPKPEYRRAKFSVSVDRSINKFECECAKFEKDGLLCCHILRLFTQWDIVEIPNEYILPRWTSEFREKELLKFKQESIEVTGNNSSEKALRYAMLMNSMNDVCADMSMDANKSKIFIDEVQKLHKRLMSEENPQSNASNSLVLKDPPVIKRKTASNTEEEAVESMVSRDENSLNIWVNADGTISDPVENRKKTAKPANKKKQQVDTQVSAIKDPPISDSKSVNKGNRLKPQSEKNSRKKKGPKEPKSAGK